MRDKQRAKYLVVSAEPANQLEEQLSEDRTAGQLRHRQLHHYGKEVLVGAGVQRGLGASSGDGGGRAHLKYSR